VMPSILNGTTRSSRDVGRMRSCYRWEHPELAGDSGKLENELLRIFGDATFGEARYRLVIRSDQRICLDFW